mgnify:CR=1 FL=1
MFIKGTSSKKIQSKDKVTNFMIQMTNQFKDELKKSNSTNETLGKLQEFVMVLQTVLTMDKEN